MTAMQENTDRIKDRIITIESVLGNAKLQKLKKKLRN